MKPRLLDFRWQQDAISEFCAGTGADYYTATKSVLELNAVFSRTFNVYLLVNGQKPKFDVV